jgi:RNA polymerase sigma-70 factor (ECF subfamily)
MSGKARPISFAEIYGEFEPKIRRYLSRLVGRTESEDLTQEVFAKVSQALPEFRGDSKASTWVYRIATNAAFDRLRSPSTRPARPALLQILSASADRLPGIEQWLERQEMNECVRRYIDELPPDYRAALLLSEDEGLTAKQISVALGITVPTVKIRLHRARTRLRAALDSGCALYRDERNELACEPRAAGVSSGD